jgi:hypothetical protein
MTRDTNHIHPSKETEDVLTLGATPWQPTTRL